MTTNEKKQKKPFWLLIEEEILALGTQDVSEAAIKQLAGALDEKEVNVSKRGGNLLKLRWAVDRMREAGRPLLKDLNSALEALTLDDVKDLFGAANGLLDNLGKTWPELKDPEHRPDVIRMIEKTRLDLMVAKAKAMDGDQGIRFLIEDELADDVIVDVLGISAEQLAEVHAKIKAELAERERVSKLLAAVADKSKEDQVQHLFENDVEEALIMEMAQVDQGVIDAVKKAMEEAMREKERLAAEEAERKKKEAEGPALEDIPAEQMIDYIDSIREIMEFSEEEKEIRVMCEQSSIPKALVDIAVSEPEKLDELEKQAQG
jgi:hypothetical protein